MKTGHIAFSEIIRMSLANLWYKRSRSTLTFIGILVGVGAIYLLLSFGFGLQQLLEGQVANGRAMSVVDVSVVNSDILTLNGEVATTLSDIDHVTDVTGVNTLAGKLNNGNATTDVVVYGVDALYFSISNLRVTRGSVPQNDSEKGIVVNTGLLNLLGLENSDATLGKSIKLVIPTGDETEDATFELPIAAIIESGESSELFMLHSQMKDLKNEDYSVIKVIVDSQDNVSDTRQLIEGLGFATASPLDTVKQLRDTTLIVNIVLASLGSVGVLIASLGMINTLTISLLERTREIALMLTIGARRRDILFLFMADALILSIIGGALGIAVAVGAGFGIDMFLNSLAHERGAVDSFSLFVVSPLLILGVLAAMVCIGLLVALFPARRASRINPVDAMREE